jgi:hypothetical protein
MEPRCADASDTANSSFGWSCWSTNGRSCERSTVTSTPSTTDSRRNGPTASPRMAHAVRPCPHQRTDDLPQAHRDGPADLSQWGRRCCGELLRPARCERRGNSLSLLLGSLPRREEYGRRWELERPRQFMSISRDSSLCPITRPECLMVERKGSRLPPFAGKMPRTSAPSGRLSLDSDSLG